MIKKWIEGYLWRRKVRKIRSSPYSAEKRVKDLEEIGIGAEILEIGAMKLVVVRHPLQRKEAEKKRLDK